MEHFAGDNDHGNHEFLIHYYGGCHGNSGKYLCLAILTNNEECQFSRSTTCLRQTYTHLRDRLTGPIGQRGNDIYGSFTWKTEADKDKYDKVVENVDQLCAPRVNVVALTHKLLTVKQGQMAVDEYVTALHIVAMNCNLGSKEQYDRMMIQALLLGVESDRV